MVKVHRTAAVFFRVTIGEVTRFHHQGVFEESGERCDTLTPPGLREHGRSGDYHTILRRLVRVDQANDCAYSSRRRTAMEMNRDSQS